MIQMLLHFKFKHSFSLLHYRMTVNISFIDLFGPTNIPDPTGHNPNIPVLIL